MPRKELAIATSDETFPEVEGAATGFETVTGCLLTDSPVTFNTWPIRIELVFRPFKLINWETEVPWRWAILVNVSPPTTRYVLVLETTGAAGALTITAGAAGCTFPLTVNFCPGRMLLPDSLFNFWMELTLVLWTRAICDKVSPVFTVYVVAEFVGVLGTLVFCGEAAGVETAAILMDWFG